jgi:hypothetical protein
MSRSEWEEWEPTWRDRVAHKLANAALRLASRTYRNLIDGSIRLGMRCAAEHRNPDLDGPSKPRRTTTAAEASTWTSTWTLTETDTSSSTLTLSTPSWNG